MYPACLPLQTRSSNEGIHSGWSKQIPKDFLEQNAPAFVKVYDEFFKQQVKPLFHASRMLLLLLSANANHEEHLFVIRFRSFDVDFNLQQYRMEILERCDDPNNYDANGLPVKYPTNPVYPPGIMLTAYIVTKNHRRKYSG